MRFVQAVLILTVSASSALAQGAPVIVVPGKPGVPVLMDGVDVSWAVIEGELGLDRPGAVTPTVIYRLGPPIAYGAAYAPGYFPATGGRPGYGRLEIVPPPDQPLPRPAPSYNRSWSSQSAPDAAATTYAPFDAPSVIGFPRSGRHQRENAAQYPGGGTSHGGAGHGHK